MKRGGIDNKWRGLVDTPFFTNWGVSGGEGGDDNKWKSLGKNQETRIFSMNVCHYLPVDMEGEGGTLK